MLMKFKLKDILKNIIYSMSSNVISLIISIVITLIVPKIIGVEEYGYWQLYLLYVSYVGFLNFGWNSGIYIKYGGLEYSELDKKIINGQIVTNFIFQVIVSIGFYFLSRNFININDTRMVLFITINIILINFRSILIFLLLATNQIKKYSINVVYERVFFLCFIGYNIYIGNKSYEMLVVSDLVGKFISLIFLIVVCRDIVFIIPKMTVTCITEMFSNINIGLKLMLADIVNTLVLGVTKLSIERVWSIKTFGEISFVISITNLVMVFVNAVGIIFFPILKKIERQELEVFFDTMRTILNVLLLGCLFFYYPLRFFLLFWMPKYSESIKYFAIVFPICYLEGMMALLYTVYLKVLRKEKLILFINIITLILSIGATYYCAVVINNLFATVGVFIITYFTRMLISKRVIIKELSVKCCRGDLLEIALVFIFIVSGTFVRVNYSMFIYLFSYLGYLVLIRNELVSAIRSTRELIGS